MSSSNIQKGLYFAVITALISGVSNYVNKIAVSSIKPPLVFTAEKNAFVALLIIGILIATFKWRKLKNLTQKEILYLTLIGIIGGAIPFYLFFTGLSLVPAITGALIHKTLFIWVAILAIPFLKEKVTKLQIFAVLLLFAANFLIGGLTPVKLNIGALMIFTATLFWAVENILAKKILPNVDPDIVTAFRMGLGSLILIAASAVVAPKALSHALTMSSSQWFWMSITVVLLLGYVTTWYRALKYAPAIAVAAILVSATLITNILSAVFLTHKWTIDMLIQSGLTIVAIGIFFYVFKQKNPQLKLAKAASK
jgi:drug/metabolite transporter (DMT)-like permease